MQAVSASTSAGSTAGNMPTRNWLRPSFRYGSVSTIPFARKVAAMSSAASAASVTVAVSHDVDRPDDLRTLRGIGDERVREGRLLRP